MEFEILYTIQELHTPLLDRAMVFITTLGNGGMLWIVMAITFLANRKTRRCGCLMLITMAICYLTGNLFLKNTVQRIRPCELDQAVMLKIPRPGEYSFPSGHTLHAFAAATMVFLNNKKAGTALLFLAVLMGFSRLYLFVHFPTDVLAGMVLGTGVAILVYKISERVRTRQPIKE